MIVTRHDYLNGDRTHNEYWGQFITQPLIEMVGDIIGIERILASEDPHLNDIPLREWDRLYTKQFIDIELWAKAGNGVDPKGKFVNEVTGRYQWSASDNVCIGKAAARFIIKANSK